LGYISYERATRSHPYRARGLEERSPSLELKNLVHRGDEIRHVRPALEQATKVQANALFAQVRERFDLSVEHKLQALFPAELPLSPRSSAGRTGTAFSFSMSVLWSLALLYEPRYTYLVVFVCLSVLLV